MKKSLPQKTNRPKKAAATSDPRDKFLREHMRLAQGDILEFSRNPKHVSPEWPEGYWPAREAPPSEKAWKASMAAFKKDLRAMERLIADKKTDLYAKLPWGDGHTVLREALLVADHNAYHLGQLVMLKKSIGIGTLPLRKTIVETRQAASLR